VNGSGVRNVPEKESTARVSATGSDRAAAIVDAGAEPVLYVNDVRYLRLSALLHDARAHREPTEPATGDEVTRLLFDESRMLDECRYDEWMDLFASECIYWVPSRFEPTDPRVETSIYLDDRRRLGDRVAAIRTGALHAQNPRSRTRRMLSNIERWAAADGSVRARANIVIWEHRRAVTRSYPGWQAYEIVRDAQGRAVVASKIVCLLDCDAPLGNYAFIL